MRCRWDDDVVFRNQGKTEKRPKRFINDTIRNDFHVNFMNTVFRQFCVFSQTSASYNSWEYCRAQAACSIVPSGKHVNTDSPIARLQTGQYVVAVFSNDKLRRLVYSSPTSSRRTVASWLSMSVLRLVSSSLVITVSMLSINCVSHLLRALRRSATRHRGAVAAPPPRPPCYASPLLQTLTPCDRSARESPAGCTPHETAWSGLEETDIYETPSPSPYVLMRCRKMLRFRPESHTRWQYDSAMLRLPKRWAMISSAARSSPSLERMIYVTPPILPYRFLFQEGVIWKRAQEFRRVVVIRQLQKLQQLCLATNQHLFALKKQTLETCFRHSQIRAHLRTLLLLLQLHDLLYDTDEDRKYAPVSVRCPLNSKCCSCTRTPVWCETLSSSRSSSKSDFART